MQELVREYLNELGKKQKKRRRFSVVAAVFAVAVVGAVIWGLARAGIATTGEVKCGQEEHTHTEACYGSTLSCGQEENEGHAHTEACYQEVSSLVCGQEESEEHAHTEECYQTETLLTCGQEEYPGHIHTEACYMENLTCGLEEHTHTEGCYIDSNADVEDSSKWAAQYESVEWKEAWGEDLVIAAQMQLDYKESVENYIVAEDGSHKGYTRFGQFVDDRYIDWDAAFVNFCMYYAGLTSSEMFPNEKKTSEWYDKFVQADEGKNKVYLTASEDYEPEAGDIIFLKNENKETEFQMGIVSSYNKEDKEKNEIKVIEGNSDNKVQENTYNIADIHISEYLKISEMEKVYKNLDVDAETDEPAEDVGEPSFVTETEEIEEGTDVEEKVPAESVEKIYTSDEFIVTASYTAEANIPEEAELIAEKVTPEADEAHYAEREAEFKEMAQNEDAVMKALLKIGFYVDGEEVEPESTVTITVQFLDENGLAEGKPVTIVHFADGGAEVLDGGKASDNSTTFQTEGFSEFAIGEGVEEEAIAKGEAFPVNKSFLYESELYHVTFRIVGNACEKEEDIDITETDKAGQENDETAENSEAGDTKVESKAKEVVAEEIDANAEVESKYQLKVKTLDKATSEYQDFAKYAEETGEGETQIGFQVIQYTLYYDGIKLDLTDCEVTAEISTTETLEERVQNMEEEAEGDGQLEETEDLQEIKRPDNEIGSLLAAPIVGESVQPNVLGTMASATESDNVLTLGTENSEEEEESGDGVLVTVYGVTENEEMSKLGETVIPEEELSQPEKAMTVSLASDKMAIDTSNTPNPEFTVQYYSELERIEMLSAEDDPKLNELVQAVKNETTGSGKFVKQYEIIRNGFIPVINTEGAKLPQNELNQSVTYLRPNSDGSVVTKKVMTKIYKDRTTEYRRQPNLNYFDALLKNDSYNLSQIWVLNGSATSGTKICTEHRHSAQCWKDGKVICGKEEHTTHTAECYSENWRKVDYVKGETHFTNREAVKDEDPEHYIYIADGAKLRLVYDREDPKNENLAATFYDYDISSSSSKNTNGVSTMQTKSGGINAAARTPGTVNYAFGNNNSGTNYGTLEWGGNRLNMSNHNTAYKGCTFGIVTGISGTGKDQTVVFNSGISAPQNLFDSKDIAGAKKVYGDGTLTYSRDGDTYTLISADSTVGSAGNLNLFEHPAPYYDPLNNKEVNNTHIWTNNFWPMDNVAWQTRTDFNFGEADQQLNRQYNEGGRWKIFPASDDGKDHNSYFGMKHQVKFKLSSDYVGPLEYYFFGDDDLWVFLDNQLVCDVGGVHSSVGEYVNLWNYLEQGSEGEHTLSFFYTERGASGSTCWMQFTLPSVTTDSITTTEDYYGKLRVEKAVEQNNGEVKYTGDDEFEFEIFFTGANGEKLGDDFPYTKHDASGKEIAYNVVLHDGSIFKLKNGEYIVVHDIPAGTKYVVKEKSGSVHVGNVDYAYSPNITIDGSPITGSEATGSISGAGTSVVKYTNKFSVYKLPSTGGSGIYWYMFSGAALISAASLMTYRKKRRGVLRS